MKKFFNQLQQDAIIAAIRDAEKTTSGEIRIFVSRKNVDDPVAAAQAQFEKLGMTKTRHRNGVLIFVAPKARKFAVIGDTAVHKQCGDAFWQLLAGEMTGYFKTGDFSGGIIHGIRKTGELLAVHFPPSPGDANELPDEIEGD
jgi:uncharacterized membrane protein